MSVSKVIKRDGSKVDYDIDKISKAIQNVNSRTNEISNEDLDKLLTIIQNKINKLKEQIKVEDI